MTAEELAAQLRKPEGEQGQKVAENMNENNKFMTLHSIDLLHIEAGDCVLEIGPGNAKYAALITDKAENVSYHGIDYSLDMVTTAMNLNKKGVQDAKMKFHHGNALQLPFEPETFDKVLTVNTIYFMDDLKRMFAEISRVLKPGGTCCITYADKEFMKSLPFTEFGFTMYEPAEIIALMKLSALVPAQNLQMAEEKFQIEDTWYQRKVNFQLAGKTL